MTGAQMVTKFTNMVDDVIDSDYTYQLLNDAINEAETQHSWEQLKHRLQFNGTSVTLPTRDFEVLKLYEDASRIPYINVPFEDQDRYKYMAYYYWIDLNAGVINLTNQNPPTMNLYYTQYSNVIGPLDTWQFPTWCHPLIPYIMAKNYYPSNAGEKGRAWDDRWEKEQLKIEARMGTWDDRLKAMNRRRIIGQIYSPKAINDYSF